MFKHLIDSSSRHRFAVNVLSFLACMLDQHHPITLLSGIPLRSEVTDITSPRPMPTRFGSGFFFSCLRAPVGEDEYLSKYETIYIHTATFWRVSIGL